MKYIICRFVICNFWTFLNVLYDHLKHVLLISDVEKKYQSVDLMLSVLMNTASLPNEVSRMKSRHLMLAKLLQKQGRQWKIF